MGLNRVEIKYITKKLAVSPEIVEKLTEDETDENLLLGEVSVRGIKKDDCFKISPLNYIKLVIYRYSYDTGFEINEKKYIAQTVYNHYLPIKKIADYNLIVKDGGEKRGQIFLIVAGLFSDVIPLKILYPNYRKEIQAGFQEVKQLKELNQHTQEWEEILKEIKTKNWLNTLDDV